jgi:hypothetical protein
MDNDGIPIWIGDDRHVANGRLQRFKSEWASVFFEPRDGGSEILHFETDRSAARGRFPIRCAVPDPERVRPDIVFDEPLVSLSEKPRFFEPQHALIEPARPLKVCDGITGKCDVGDVHAVPFFVRSVCAHAALQCGWLQGALFMIVGRDHRTANSPTV